MNDRTLKSSWERKRYL